MKIVGIMARSKGEAIDDGHGQLPWKLPSDMTFFKRKTGGYPIIMGRRTMLSLGDKPLHNRLNIVLTHDSDLQIGKAMCEDDIETAIGQAWRHCRQFNRRTIYVIGGAQVMREMLGRNFIDSFYLSEVALETEPEGATKFAYEFSPDRWKATPMRVNARLQDDCVYTRTNYVLKGERAKVKWGKHKI